MVDVYYPLGSMELVYLPAFTLKQIHVGKCISHMSPMELIVYFGGIGASINGL